MAANPPDRPRMTTTPAELAQRIAALRAGVMELLGDCVADQGAARGARLIVALQDVSNRLGAAEAILNPSPPVALAPPPIEQSRRAGTSDAEAPAPVSTGPFTAEAAVVLALAEITVPFADTRQDEAERWMRVLRQEGQVGAALQALGIDQPPQLATRAEPRHPADTARGHEAVRAVGEQATDLAHQRGGDRGTTSDLLFAVMIAYGPLFDRTLYAAGTDRGALLDQLSRRAAAAHIR